MLFGPLPPPTWCPTMTKRAWDTTHLGPSWYVFFYINFFSLFTNNVYITPNVTNTTQGNNNIGNGLRTQMTHTYVPLGLWVSFFIVFISYFCFYCIIGYKYRTSSEMSTLQMSQFAHLISSILSIVPSTLTSYIVSLPPFFFFAFIYKSTPHSTTPGINTGHIRHIPGIFFTYFLFIT